MAGAHTHHVMDTPTCDEPTKLLVVVSPYYKDISDKLLAGAVAQIEAAGASYEVQQMPGALEIPPAIRIADRQGNFDGYVALGCIIRGETTHYDTVCTDSSRGLMLLGLQGCNIGNGILTVENHAQAEQRADPGDQNKGGGAAAAALHLIAMQRKYGPKSRGLGFRPGGNDEDDGSFQIA